VRSIHGPWSGLQSLVEPHYAKAGNGRRPVGLEIHAANLVILGQGTFIPIRITDPISSKTAKPNDEFHGTVAANVFQSNLVLIPSGTSVLGRVVEAKEAGHFVGQALLTIELVSIRL
jgi:type IV secretory pathway VirB10-like protein